MFGFLLFVTSIIYGIIQPAHQSTYPRNVTYAAHLMGYNQKFEQPPWPVPGNQFIIPRWIHKDGLAFTNAVHYRHGRLTVSADGLYFVYSHVSFTESSSSRDDNTDSNSLSHYLYRYNIMYPNGGEEMLLMNSFNTCSANNEQAEYSSYLGALFKLRNGDELFVKVSNLTLLVTNSKINTFGYFKIGDST
ncbi:TNFSF6 [Mytilus coruscus]|uniref:TNFSF6 n=1 Tax=Mytilus coruscus TaxID=42192 RepID=A0A6J8E638_MYTCO|nr:TNFSF6 [Mytilus coruscus]